MTDLDDLEKKALEATQIEKEECCIEGCSSKSYVKGMCSKHYQRVKLHGNPHKEGRTNPLERFWSKVDKSDSCWTWNGFNTRGGYPRFFPGNGSKGGTVLAHRWLYQELHGPIPASMHVDHICRNRACVRPDHLRLLTPAENGLYAMRSCRWVAKSVEDIETLGKENVKSISVEKEAILYLIARCRKAEARVAELEAQSGEVICYRYRPTPKYENLQVLFTPKLVNYLGYEPAEPLYLRAPQAVPEDVAKDAARWRTIELMMFLGNVELNQDEDGGYSINLDPAENIMVQRWEGNSPEEVIDAAIAVAPSPEGEKE